MPQPKSTARTIRRIILAVAVILILSIVGIAFVVLLVRIATDNSARTACANNLRQFGTRLVANHAQKSWTSGWNGP